MAQSNIDGASACSLLIRNLHEFAILEAELTNELKIRHILWPHRVLTCRSRCVIVLLSSKSGLPKIEIGWSKGVGMAGDMTPDVELHLVLVAVRDMVALGVQYDCTILAIRGVMDLRTMRYK